MNVLLRLTPLLLLLACNNAPTAKPDVILHTDKGDIALKLYNDTPKHKANFLKLAAAGYFDGMAFHRIIEGFMVQCGDPATKPGATSKADGPGYTVEAEIVPAHAHVSGTLGAAREGDDINPTRASAGSQFYLVTGKRITAAKLDSMELVISGMRREAIALQYTASGSTQPYEEYLKANGYQPFTYTPAQREAYLKEGGAPWLDGGYTAFGEIVQGLEVAFALSRTPVRGEIPTEAVRIVRAEVVK